MGKSKESGKVKMGVKGSVSERGVSVICSRAGLLVGAIGVSVGGLNAILLNASIFSHNQKKGSESGTGSEWIFKEGKKQVKDTHGGGRRPTERVMNIFY